MDSKLVEGWWADFLNNTTSADSRTAAQQYLNRQRGQRRQQRLQRKQGGQQRQYDDQWKGVKLSPEQEAILQKFQRAFEAQLDQFLKDLKIEIASKRPKFAESWKKLKDLAGGAWQGVTDPLNMSHESVFPIEFYKTLREEFNILEFEGPANMPFVQRSNAARQVNYAGRDIDDMLVKFKDKVMKSFSYNLQQTARRILRPQPQDPWHRGMANLQAQQQAQAQTPQQQQQATPPAPPAPVASPASNSNATQQKPGRALDQWNDDWMIHKDHTEIRRELAKLVI